MKKTFLALLTIYILFSISCKDEKVEDMEEECNCCESDCIRDPGENFAAVALSIPSKARLNDEARDEWSSMEISVTYNGEDGGTISVSGVPQGGEAVWFSSDYTFNANQSIFTMSDGIERKIETTSSKVTISFEIGTNNRLASFDGDWLFEW